ncbi:MAG: tripartite tricarboxylate transporter substrate binding protein [Deltaproteobacteria bacterium]|nr:tripartite tricarboxylate transporter substrate binding protein [Deltaproteobacteria bacterium]
MDGKKILSSLSAVFLFFALIGTAIAAEFPTKPIKVIVGYSPGGTTDLLARAVAGVAPEFLGQSMVTINKPGATGTIAAKEVADANPDGYTLTIAGGSESTAVGHFKKLPYHPIDSFAPVIRFVKARMIICFDAKAPWKTFKDFVEDAKKNPGKYKYASSGHGGIYHAALLAMCYRTGIKMKHVPYKGGAPGLAALMGGHVDVTIGSDAEIWPMVQGGKIRAMTLTSLDRSPILKDVPTLKELGYDVYLENQKGFVAPAKTPRERIMVLHDALKKVYDHPAFKKMAEQLKLELSYMGPEDFRKALQDMSNQIGEVVKTLGE